MTTRPSEPNLQLKPADWVSQVRAYQAQSSPYPVELKLDANEGPAPDQVRAFSQAPLNVYPDTRSLEARLAHIHGISPAQVLVTNGGDDAIDRACRVFLQQGRNLILPEPTFTMIRQYAVIAGGEVRSVPWYDRAFPTDAIREVGDADTNLIAFVSPNNPTGATISADEVREVAREFPQAALLIDQAYAEFEAPRDTAQQLTEVALRELPNAVVIRTFSKSFGLAGLRIGYALGQPELIDWLRRAGSPYPVAGPALQIAIQALEAPPETRETYIQHVATQRGALRTLLMQFGIASLPSEGNFVLVDFSDTPFSAAAVCEQLAAMGISVRSFSGLPASLRITCPGEPAAFSRLCESLRSILAAVEEPQS